MNKEDILILLNENKKCLGNIKNIKIDLLKKVINENGGIEKYSQKIKKETTLFSGVKYYFKNIFKILTKTRCCWMIFIALLIAMKDTSDITGIMVLTIGPFLMFYFEIVAFFLSVYEKGYQPKNELKLIIKADKEDNFYDIKNKVLNNNLYASSTINKESLECIISNILNLTNKESVQCIIKHIKDSKFSKEEKNDNLSNVSFLNKVIECFIEEKGKEIKSLENKIKLLDKIEKENKKREEDRNQIKIAIKKEEDIKNKKIEVDIFNNNINDKLLNVAKITEKEKELIKV